MDYKQFYAELGKLLYAVADVDGMISEKEKKSLQEIVRKELVPIEDSLDHFGTDSAFYTNFEFDILDDAIEDPAIAFESFIQFIENYQSDIDIKMIHATRKVAIQLANAYKNTNKKEKELLSTLNKKLNALLKEQNYLPQK